MKIQLKGDLDIELTGLGCKPGDIIEVTPDPVSKVGAMNFARYKSGVMCNCVVWPVNYDVVNDEITPAPAPAVKTSLTASVEIPFQTISDILITALEGGSNYWYYLPDLRAVKKLVKEIDISKSERIALAVFRGASIPVHDTDAEEGEEAMLGYLNLENIKRGINLYINDGRALNPCIDADEADLFFQFVVMGKIVFG